jgi:hypothetical protein
MLKGPEYPLKKRVFTSPARSVVYAQGRCRCLETEGHLTLDESSVICLKSGPFIDCFLLSFPLAVPLPSSRPLIPR